MGSYSIETFVAKQIGGKLKHKLTIDEIPSHSHGIQALGMRDSRPIEHIFPWTSNNGPILTWDNDGGPTWYDGSTKIKIDKAGNENPTQPKLMQPYYVLNIWVRIS